MWRFSPPEGGFFTERELRQVEALFGEILPGDPERGVPGAKEAGAAAFLDGLLAMDGMVYYEIPRWQALYREALDALSRSCTEAFGRPVEDLPEDERREIVGRLAAGKLEGFPKNIDQKKFFEVLRKHCIQGCFADPRWGGNREGIMWRWYGYLRPAEEVL